MKILHLFWSKQLRQVLQSCVLSLKIKTDENIGKIINIFLQIQLFKLQKQDCVCNHTYTRCYGILGNNFLNERFKIREAQKESIIGQQI
jgi:hypothetical protein